MQSDFKCNPGVTLANTKSGRLTQNIAGVGGPKLSGAVQPNPTKKPKKFTLKLLCF